MGRLSRGILSSVQGKVGTVVGGYWRGIEYVRGLPVKRKRKPTHKQEIQRLKFAVASKFINPFMDLFMISFKDFDSNMTGQNSALSYTIKAAIVGDFPGFAVNYSLAKVARGSIQNAGEPSATSTIARKISFKWEDNSGIGKAKPTDRAILVAYHSETETGVYTIGSAVRSDEAAELLMPALSGKAIETWLAFITEDGEDTSSSVHTGKIVLA